MNKRELYEAIIRNAEQALCGPLGYDERQAVIASAKEAKEKLAALN